MPLAWSISHPSRFVRVVGKGQVTLSELMHLLKSIDAAGASSYRAAVDLSCLTDGLPAAAQKGFASLVRHRGSTRTVGPLAIIVGSALAHRRAARFAEQAQGNRLIQVFDDQIQAHKWLNSFYAFERAARVVLKADMGQPS